MNIPSLPQDKANHLAYGALLCALGASAAALMGWPLWVAALTGLAVCTGAAAWKEWRDAHTLGAHVEALDAAATVLGGVFVALPLLCAHLAATLWP